MVYQPCDKIISMDKGLYKSTLFNSNHQQDKEYVAAKNVLEKNEV